MNGFMFRDQEIRRIQTALQRKESVLLTGICRIGKTALMKEIVRRHNATHSGKAVYLDVSDYIRLYDFYDELLAGMPKPFIKHMAYLLQTAQSIPDVGMNWLRRHIDGASKIKLREPVDEATVIRYWEPIAKAMLESLEASSDSNEIPFFVIDEFPYMLKNLLDRKVPAEEVAVALAMLRKLRDSGIPMLLSSSISLENLLALHTIPHTVLGGLQRESLRPFTRSEARSYLEARLADHPTAVEIDLVLARLPDYIPDFLNQSVHYLNGLPDASNVDVVMDNEVLPAIRRSFDEPFQERLTRNYPDPVERFCAEQMLDQLARAPETGTPIDTSKLPPIHPQALTKLKHDMFIEEASSHGYRFTLNALRLWWCSQRGMAG